MVQTLKENSAGQEVIFHCSIMNRLTGQSAMTRWTTLILIKHQKLHNINIRSLIMTIHLI